ncbi:hypothetical protein LZG75_06355 [Polynucleobacter sp. IMCC30063]|uniref:hypothetical protein n=1 Tax=Polynucleobacter sp. IMCC30063 TaxID=2907298 RepID=UPI001F30610A|nr:hypothetical protein [Polynucleobacter sp. IMCC30063]MCE7505862.1 hypothetical protein [Polynucleobacter sp. IMCC30063]
MKFIHAIVLNLLLMGLAHGESFRFVALGDMPYNNANDEYRYLNLIQAINQSHPKFSLFVGDTKSSETPCSDAATEKIASFFKRYEAPVIYSIGDNEWTDCYRPLSGSYDPIERLASIRKKFFSSNQSLGKNTLTLIRQADVMSDFKLYVENSYWIQDQFLFVSLNIPGSNNDFERNILAVKEYFKRNEANLAWINYTFQLATEKKLAGIIFAFQADMFTGQIQSDDLANGYRDTVLSLSSHAEKFSNAVLLIHGDTHRLRIDQPLKTSDQKYVLENVIRVELMGEEEIQALEITVDARQNSPFSFRPLIVKRNSEFSNSARSK